MKTKQIDDQLDLGLEEPSINIEADLFYDPNELKNSLEFTNTTSPVVVGSDLLFHKHAALVHSRQDGLTEVQTKMMGGMLLFVQHWLKSNPDFEISDKGERIRIPVSALETVLNQKFGSLTRLKTDVRALMKVIIEPNITEERYDEKDGELLRVLAMDHLFTSTRLMFSTSGEKYISAIFPSHTLQLLGNPAKYALLSLPAMQTLSGKGTYRLYENVMRWAFVGKTPFYKLETARAFLSVSNVKSYHVWSEFKRGILIPAIKEIEAKTGIVITMETDRKRGVGHVQFCIDSSKSTTADAGKRKPTVKKSANKVNYDDIIKSGLSEAYNTLIDAGITDREAYKYVKSVPQDVIYATYHSLNSQRENPSITSYAGLFVTQLKKNHEEWETIQKIKAAGVLKGTEEERKAQRTAEELKAKMKRAEEFISRTRSEIKTQIETEALMEASEEVRLGLKESIARDISNGNGPIGMKLEQAIAKVPSERFVLHMLELAKKDGLVKEASLDEIEETIKSSHLGDDYKAASRFLAKERAKIK